MAKRRKGNREVEVRCDVGQGWAWVVHDPAHCRVCKKFGPIDTSAMNKFTDERHDIRFARHTTAGMSIQLGTVSVQGGDGKLHETNDVEILELIDDLVK